MSIGLIVLIVVAALLVALVLTTLGVLYLPGLLDLMWAKRRARRAQRDAERRRAEFVASMARISAAGNAFSAALVDTFTPVVESAAAAMRGYADAMTKPVDSEEGSNVRG